jgi:asparagine synthetase B (glutamine-hydrolysing)
MDRGHNKRLDRISMKHTLEIRSPFYDEKLVEFAMRINSKLKIKKNGKEIITKYILRKTALNYLPEYIAFRYKAPFSNGAGMNVGNDYKIQDGEVTKKVIEKYKSLKFSNTNHDYKFLTNEERIYFEIFNSFNYTKLENNHERIITKEDLDSIESKCLKDYSEDIKEYFHKKKISRNLISNIDNSQTVISNSLNTNMELKLIGFFGR